VASCGIAQAYALTTLYAGELGYLDGGYGRGAVNDANARAECPCRLQGSEVGVLENSEPFVRSQSLTTKHLRCSWR
jgi:hypothetical protein